MLQHPSDSLQEWIDYYLQMAVAGIRPESVTHKIQLHLYRFQAIFAARYGQETISSCVKRHVLARHRPSMTNGITLGICELGTDARCDCLRDG